MAIEKNNMSTKLLAKKLNKSTVNTEDVNTYLEQYRQKLEKELVQNNLIVDKVNNKKFVKLILPELEYKWKLNNKLFSDSIMENLYIIN